MKNKILLILLVVFAAKTSAETCIDFNSIKTTITKTHLKGELGKATDLSYQALQCSIFSNQDKIEIRLILATIYDRMRLHNYSRPHPQMLKQIEIAASTSEKSAQLSHAKVQFSYAEYYYRAEMPERLFPKTKAYALDALKGFKMANDRYGESDASHLLGLIHLQKKDYTRSRHYFDLSLKLENLSKNPRPRILADYERHIGFIHLRLGENKNALPYFERSFKIRRESGIDDAALFAAQSLASTLVKLGRISEAYQPIDYAINMAKKLNSSYGIMISLPALATIHEQTGDIKSAQKTYLATLEVAEKLNHKSAIKNSKNNLKRLDHLIPKT